MRSIKLCIDGNLERVFSLGGHGNRRAGDRSLHSGNVLPRAETLKRTIKGSIDLTNDSAHGTDQPGIDTINGFLDAAEKNLPGKHDSREGFLITTDREFMEGQPSVDTVDVAVLEPGQASSLHGHEPRDTETGNSFNKYP